MSFHSVGPYSISEQQLLHARDISSNLESARVSVDISDQNSGKTICMLHVARQFAESGKIRTLVLITSESKIFKLQKILSETGISKYVDVCVYTYEMMTNIQVYGSRKHKRRAIVIPSPREKQRRKHTTEAETMTNYIADPGVNDEDRDSENVDTDFATVNSYCWDELDMDSPEFIVMCTRSGRYVPSPHFKSLISNEDGEENGVLVACLNIDSIYNVGTNTYTNISALVSFACSETTSVYMHFMSSSPYSDKRGRMERYYLSLCSMFKTIDLQSVTRTVYDPPMHVEKKKGNSKKEGQASAKKVSGFAIRKRDASASSTTIVRRLVLKESGTVQKTIMDVAQTGIYAMLSHLPVGKDEAALSVFWKGPMNKYRVFRSGPLTSPKNHQIMASLVYMRGNMFLCPPSDSRIHAVLSTPVSMGNTPKVVFHTSDGQQTSKSGTSSSCASSLSSTSSTFSSSCSTFSSSSSSTFSSASSSSSFPSIQRLKQDKSLTSVLFNEGNVDTNIRRPMIMMRSHAINLLNSPMFSILDSVEKETKSDVKKTTEKPSSRSTISVYTKCYVPDADALEDSSREFVHCKMLAGRRMEELIVKASSREYKHVDVAPGSVVDKGTTRLVNDELEYINSLSLLRNKAQSDSFCSVTDQDVSRDNIRDAYSLVIGQEGKVDERFRLHLEPILESLCKLEMQKTLVLLPQVLYAFSLSEKASFAFKLVISAVFSKTVMFIVENIVNARARVELYVCNRSMGTKETERNIALFKASRRPALIVFLQDVIDENTDLADAVGDMPVVTIVFPSFNKTAMQHALRISSLNTAAKSNSIVYVPFFRHIETEVTVLKVTASRLYEDISMSDFEMMLMSIHSSSGVFHPAEFIELLQSSDKLSFFNKVSHIKARIAIEDRHMYETLKSESVKEGANRVNRKSSETLYSELKRLHTGHLNDCKDKQRKDTHDIWPIAYFSLLYKELLRRIYQMAFPILCDAERTVAELNGNSSDKKDYAMDLAEIISAISTWESVQLMHPENFLLEFFPGMASEYVRGVYGTYGSFSAIAGTPLRFISAGTRTHANEIVKALLGHFKNASFRVDPGKMDFSSSEEAIDNRHNKLFPFVLDVLLQNKLFY